jgi:hypothetical protein
MKLFWFLFILVTVGPLWSLSFIYAIQLAFFQSHPLFLILFFLSPAFSVGGYLDWKESE